MKKTEYCKKTHQNHADRGSTSHIKNYDMGDLSREDLSINDYIYIFLFITKIIMFNTPKIEKTITDRGQTSINLEDDSVRFVFEINFKEERICA